MEKVCPRCQSSSYLVPGLKLLVNSCGHRLCESCVNVVFSRPSAPCPECGIVLRKNLFRVQQFEDPHVEIEVDTRKKILRDYNKVKEDFPTLREYNDYLEEVETIIYNLSNDINAEETRAKVDSYRKENQTTIMRNRMRRQRHDQVLATQIAQEQVEGTLRNEEALAKDAQSVRVKKRQKESVLEDLIYSDLSASEVLASHVAASDRAKGEEPVLPSEPSESGITYSSHQSQMGTTVYSKLPVAMGNLYTYIAPTMDTLGPEVPELEDIDSLGYVANMGGLEDISEAGGFLPSYGCRRSLQEAFSCLLLLPDSEVPSIQT